MSNSLLPDDIAWLRQCAAVEGNTYDRLLLHLLERVEALGQNDDKPTTEAAPPAAEQVGGLIADDQREAVRAAVAEALGNARDCHRVWEAWQVGTMGPDDFVLLAEDGDRVAEIADAAIEAMRPATPPAPEVGAALADLENLELAFESIFECKVRTSRIRPALLHYATLLQQQAAPAPAVVPVAVSEWDNGFMSGVCAALAVVKYHGDSTVWKEIVRSVGTDYALNYAANVNPEDWELAGFSTYAQLELGKGKPDPLPQAGEVQS